MPDAATDVVILGAGASGLICAREAAGRGRRVIVVDHSPEAGRKLLITGGGRCNFTNLNARPDAYVSANPRFCVSALAGFTPQDAIQLVDGWGLPWHEKTQGQLFLDGSAAILRDRLVADCRTAGVSFELGRTPESATREAGGFLVATDRGPLVARRLVVATGGLSAPQTGATALGLGLAARFGVKVIPPEPALVGLAWSDIDRAKWAELAGIALPDVLVTCRKRSIRESILLTHTGLSGPAILDVSLDWQPRDPVIIDLLPGFDVEAWLKATRERRGSAKPEEILLDRLPTRFARRFAADHLPDSPMARISDAGIARIVKAMRNWRIDPARTEGYEKAEVTRGGVDTKELSSKTMEAAKVPGLFFTGEVVDVTGRLGGYNLHWAWASGLAAGRAV